MIAGDRVRLIHDKEEGIIQQVMADGRVMVLLDSGFDLPMYPSELVVISQAEQRYFGKHEPAEPTEKQTPLPSRERVLTRKGYFLGLVEQSPGQLSLYLVNNTNFDMLTTLATNSLKGFTYQWSGVVKAKSDYPLEKVWKETDIHLQPDYEVQFMPFRFLHYERLQGRVGVVEWSKWKKPAKPVVIQTMGVEGYLIQLDDEPVDLSDMQRALNENQAKVVQDFFDPKAGKALPEIDLHIEKLVDNPGTLSAGEMLKLQIEVFEKQLDKAILQQADQLIFIHGVGNGILKHEIQKRLSGNIHVAWFKDARKEKFGYGATEVKLK
jgi:hypothetical protein